MEKELEREMKNKGDEVQRRFHAVVTKWDVLAASKVKISSIEKKNQQEHKQQNILWIQRLRID